MEKDIIIEHFNFLSPASSKIILLDRNLITVKFNGPINNIQIGDAVVCYIGDNIFVGNITDIVFPATIKILLSAFQLKNEKRVHTVRFPVSIAAAIAKNHKFEFAVAKDVSYTGLRLNSLLDIYNIGDVVEVNVTPTQSMNISFSGRIANKSDINQKVFEYGMEIISMSSKDRELYDSLVKKLLKKFTC
ncbi:PilZ domain-containing protein [Acetivibrio cellulolyticus]|uniref:PilZ domain-containing protein n=1 Tax=Acetivibrio cellulolyticus TaxID=35830 RepID=UPI0001E2C2CE|nr:PilZ domain-containing protein [Acetivibrio cellulolyticus]